MPSRENTSLVVKTEISGIGVFKINRQTITDVSKHRSICLIEIKSWLIGDIDNDAYSFHVRYIGQFDSHLSVVSFIVGILNCYKSIIMFVWCPLVALSGLFWSLLRMSALGDKADISKASTLIRISNVSERFLLQERVNAGLSAARNRERVGGRPKALDEHTVKIAKSLHSNHALSEIAQHLGVAKSTIHKCWTN